jgi:3-hydroxyisobutyrate dehydrogenase-like beta-hydroxyacid dehydrogenase
VPSCEQGVVNPGYDFPHDLMVPRRETGGRKDRSDFGTGRAALTEVFTMGVKARIDPVDLWSAVRQAATGRARTFDRSSTFALRLLHKDVGLAVGLGREVGVTMRLANLVYEELTEALNRD